MAKIPPTFKKASLVITEIISLGEIDVPPQFNGSGMGGETLEYLCEVERNNLDAPDLLDWEVKFHGGKSLLTLLHKDPEPVGILDKIVDNFGWLNKEGNISFRHTISYKLVPSILSIFSITVVLYLGNLPASIRWYCLKVMPTLSAITD